MSNYAYLIVVSHTLDDFPVRLEFDQEAAFEFASTVPWRIPDQVAQRLELPGANTPCCVSIITYKDGDPISRVIVREFDGDDDDDDDDGFDESPTDPVVESEVSE